jgi:ABC-2 type transport system ATP-binding protein
MHLCLQNADFKTVEANLNALDGVEGVTKIRETDSELDVGVTCQSAGDLRPDVYRKIKETDWILLDFHQETQTLEHIFRELTKES